MNYIREYICICFCLFANQCTVQKIHNTDPKIIYAGEYVLYGAEKFSGILEARMEAVNVTRHSPYSNGLLDGTEKEWYGNGQLSAERFYSEGKKVGVHRGWYPDGKDRLLYEYEDGEFHGNIWEWNSSGTLVILAKFENGTFLGKKIWRPDGQIYANFVMRGNRAIGQAGSKLCFQIRSDENKKTISF